MCTLHSIPLPRLGRTLHHILRPYLGRLLHRISPRRPGPTPFAKAAVGGFACVALFAMLALGACSPGAQRTKIGYIQITDDEVLNTAKAGVFEALKDAGFVNGQNIDIIELNAQGDLSMIPTILQSFRSQGVDLVITNSTPCMVGAAQQITEVPVVFTVAFGPEQVGMKKTPPNLYGVYDPLNTEAFVSMMQTCLPGLKRVGLPYNNAEPNAEYSAKRFSAEFEERGIEVVTATVASANDLTMVAQYLASKSVDAIVAAADNTVYMGLNAVARVADTAKIPLFVSDPRQAAKGASIGMGVNYRRWGYLSGQKAAALLKKQAVAMKIEPITETELVINPKAAAAQGLAIPQAIRDKATTIIQ